MSNKTGVVYLRVSTAMQVEGYSLDAQLTAIRKYAHNFDIDIDTDNVYKDEGKSGTNIAGRENFKRMLEDIETGKIDVDYVLVFKLSRFGRNSADILTSLQKLQLHNTELICTEDRLDSSTSSGKLLITVLSAVAEIERENIVEQTEAGRRQKALEGRWNGGIAPYGYQIGKDSVLEIVEDEAEAVHIIYDKYVNERLGFDLIAKYLNRQGLHRAPGKNRTLTLWTTAQVRRLIDNEVYKGYITYGKRGKERIKGSSNEYRTVHKDDYLLVKGLHQAIVPEDLWEEAHRLRLETGIKAPSKVGRDRVHLLSGLLRCPKCGGPMYPNPSNTTKQGVTRTFFYYSCARKKRERGVKCDYRASLRKDNIEPDVIDAIKKLVIDPILANKIKDKIGKDIDTTSIDKELEGYKKHLQQVEASKRALERDIDTMDINETHYQRKWDDKNRRLDILYNELIEVEQQIDGLMLKRAAVKSKALTLDNIYKVLESFNVLFDKMNEEEQRKTFDLLIDKVEIHTEPKGRQFSRLKSITYSFPVDYNDTGSPEINWDNDTHAEAAILMTYCGLEGK